MKLKKTLSLILLMILVLPVAFFAGCKDKYANMKIEINGDNEIVLYTEPRDLENQFRTKDITVTVSDSPTKEGTVVTYLTQNPECVNVSIGKPDSNGTSVVTFTALQGGETIVTLQSQEGEKTAMVKIKVVEFLQKFEVKNEVNITTFSNSQLKLNPNNIFKFTPSTTSQDNVKFELADAYNDIELLTENNEYVLNVKNVGTQTISLIATPIDDEGQPIADVDAVRFDVQIIRPLTYDSFVIKNVKTNSDYLYDEDKKAFETIKLTNDTIEEGSVTISVGIKTEHLFGSTAVHYISDYSVSDLQIASIDNTDVAQFKLTGLSVGDTKVNIEMSIEGYEGYVFNLEIPVNVVEVPSYVSINGSKESITGEILYDRYLGYGYEFNVTVGSESSFDKTFKVVYDAAKVKLIYANGATIMSTLDEQTQFSTTPILANGTKIYAIGLVDNATTTLTFYACGSLTYANKVYNTVEFTIKRGVVEIATEEFDNSTMFVERNLTATFDYSINPTTADDNQVYAEVLTVNGNEIVTVEKTTAGQFTVTGLKNGTVAIRLSSKNGVRSPIFNIKVYTAGTFSAVTLPSPSSTTSILNTTYTVIGSNNGRTINTLVAPFDSLKVSANKNNTSEVDYATVQLGENEDISMPRLSATIAVGSGHQFTTINDPNNVYQTIISTKYTIVEPEYTQESGVYKFVNKNTQSLVSITNGGYLSALGAGIVYVQISQGYYLPNGNGKTQIVYFNYVVAVNVYQTIKNVTLSTTEYSCVYNKQGLGDIDVLTSEFKTFTEVQLNVTPVSSVMDNNLSIETTKFIWELLGYNEEIELNYYVTSQIKELNENGEISLNDIEGIAIIFNDVEGVYEYTDNAGKIYTRAYLVFNFDEKYFSTASSQFLSFNVVVRQFSKSFSKSVVIEVQNPVKVKEVILNQNIQSCDGTQNKVMDKLDDYLYELYIDSRAGLNNLGEIQDITQSSNLLKNSWKLSASVKPDNATNTKLFYKVYDSTNSQLANENVIKVLDDGTVIPLNAGVAYIHIVPQSGELEKDYVIKVRIADGKAWETAYKVYTESEFMAIGSTRSSLRYFYELGADIYLTSAEFTPFGVNANEVIPFSGGLRGNNGYNDKVYAINNVNLAVKTSTNGTVDLSSFVGIFGEIIGEVNGINIFANINREITLGENAYMGVLASKVGKNAVINGVYVKLNSSTINSKVNNTYFGLIAGVNEGKISNAIIERQNGNDIEVSTIMTKVEGNIILNVLGMNANIGGFVGQNKGNLNSSYDYFTDNVTYNNCDENATCEMVVNFANSLNNGNVGGIAGSNTNEIEGLTSLVYINSNANNLGGVVGLNTGILTSCYFGGTVKNGKNVGGIAGQIANKLVTSSLVEVARITKCIVELIDISLSEATIVTESKISGTQNVGGLVGLSDFMVTANVNYDLPYNHITYSYVRSYLPKTEFSDIELNSSRGNLGGLIGSAKNTRVENSYAISNIILEDDNENYNIGGFIGELTNVCFTSKNGVVNKQNSVIKDSFAKGTIKIKKMAQTMGNIGQFIGYVIDDVANDDTTESYITNRVYANVAIECVYNASYSYGLVGKVVNIENLQKAVKFVKSFYLQDFAGELKTESSIGEGKTTSELKNNEITFVHFKDNGAWKYWGPKAGDNDQNLVIFYIDKDENRIPFWTSVPTKIDLNIKPYDKNSNTQPYTRVDNSSLVIKNEEVDTVSKSVVLYIYENSLNRYSFDEIIDIMTNIYDISLDYKAIKNSRFTIVSNNSQIVSIENGNDYLTVNGEGTAIITVCSSYNKTIFDKIQIAVVKNNFDLNFMVNEDNSLIEYNEESQILIKKAQSANLVLNYQDDTAIDGLRFLADLQGMDETALTINNQVLNTSNVKLVPTIVIKEGDLYEETTLVEIEVVPYFEVKLYADPNTSLDDEFLSTKQIFNIINSKSLKVLIYVGASKISFNTNEIETQITNRIDFTVTMRTDYEQDSLVVYNGEELLFSDDTESYYNSLENFSIEYFATTKSAIYENDRFVGFKYNFAITAAEKYVNTELDNFQILRDSITSSLRFCALSSMVAEADKVKYNVSNEFNFTFKGVDIGTVTIDNYACGRVADGQINALEEASTSIAPGGIGLLDIFVIPEYSNIKHITIQNGPNNTHDIAFLQLLEDVSNESYVQSNHLAVNIDRGIQLINRSVIKENGIVGFNGHFFVQTLLPNERTIVEGTEFTIIVTVFYGSDDNLQSKTYTKVLVATTPEGVYASFNGKSYTYLVKGSTITPSIKVVGYDSPVSFSISGFDIREDNYKEMIKKYLDDDFVKLITNNLGELDITYEEAQYIFDNQIRIDSETGAITVGVLVKNGVNLNIEVAVEEYVNGIYKISSSTLNVYVIDFEVESISVQNTNTSGIMNAIIGVQKSLKVNLDVKKAIYSEQEFEVLADVVREKTFTAIAQYIGLYFGRDGKTSLIESEIEILEREINMAGSGVWFYLKTGYSVENGERVQINYNYDGIFEIKENKYDKNSSLTCYAILPTEITTFRMGAQVDLEFRKDVETGEYIYKFVKEDSEFVDHYSCTFLINTRDNSSSDNPIPISTAEKFIQNVCSANQIHYVLTKDIILENWIPRDTSVYSFDGNGHTITIKSFASSNTTGNYGLFNNIGRDTILSNVTVQYSGRYNIDVSESVTSINVGLFAIYNEGTLFNCQVVPNESQVVIDVSTVNELTTVNSSMFVVENLGAISNSRVGFITNASGFAIKMNSYANMAGFAVTNKGHIASSFVKDIALYSKSTKAAYTKVAGFVGNNTQNGKIYFSYAEGIRKITDGVQISMQGITDYKQNNKGIYTPGFASGFCYANSGIIEDSYSNIPLVSPSGSAGFVYINNAEGSIVNAYSACYQVLSNATDNPYVNKALSPFTGISDYDTAQNSGNIQYAYYLSTGADNEIYKELGEVAVAIPEDSFDNQSDEFGNFLVGENKIWIENDYGPSLVSANRIIMRQRKLIEDVIVDEGNGENDETKRIYNYEEVIDGEFDTLGSYTNPIVISSAADFITIANEENLEQVAYDNSNDVYTLSLNLKDYILIKDIDMSTVVGNGLEELQNITYAGMMEGNAFTLNNVSILSEKGTENFAASFGLFNQIGAYLINLGKGAVTTSMANISYHSQLKNISIVINEISGTHATSVGAIAGVVVNSDLFNIDLIGKTDSDEEYITVQGERYVGSVAGYVAGESTFANITSNLSVNAEFRSDFLEIDCYITKSGIIQNDLNCYLFDIDVDEYTGGYAGGIFGVVDIFSLRLESTANEKKISITRFDFDKIGFNNIPVNFEPQIKSLTVYGKVNIMGDVAGGIIGLNYSGSSVYDAEFVLELNNGTQSIIGTHIVGGLVGENYGKIDQSALKHEDVEQTLIDQELNNKHNELSNTLFYSETKYPVYVGGLVGRNFGAGNYSGVVTNCYNRANVINWNASYVGGLVGYMNCGYLQYCYVTGVVEANRIRIDNETGESIGSNQVAAGAIAYLAGFVNKSGTKNFNKYTGLDHFSLCNLVVANNWKQDTDINTTAALLGNVAKNVDIKNNILTGAMDIFINSNEGKLPDVLKIGGQLEKYNIVRGSVEDNTAEAREIRSFTYDEFRNYAFVNANPNAYILYQTWDRKIWNLNQEYFPRLFLESLDNQNYIETEEDLRNIGTSGFYILLNDIYLTSNWEPKEFEGTLTSKKKEDGTYCTIYNINIDGSTLSGEDENFGNVGFFSALKDKAYIYNINFVIGGNVRPDKDKETTVDSNGNIIPVKTQSNTWAGQQITAKDVDGQIKFVYGENEENEFVNGITNSVNYRLLIANNMKDLASNLYSNNYGTGAVAGVANNASFNNITVSYAAYYYLSEGQLTSYEYQKASIKANTPNIGGFVGYSSNSKIQNCQVTDNPIELYVKVDAGTKVYIPGDAEIYVFNNGYLQEIGKEVLDGISKEYEDIVVFAKSVIEFFQRTQAVGGFVGKLDSSTNYMRFNNREIKSHIYVAGYSDGKLTDKIASPNLAIGGLAGELNAQSIDSVIVISTIDAVNNNYGIDYDLNIVDGSVNNHTSLAVGGIAGISHKSTLTSCVFRGAMNIGTSTEEEIDSKSTDSTIYVGGIVGQSKGALTFRYCVGDTYVFDNEKYNIYNKFINVDIERIKIQHLYVGGILANAELHKATFTSCFLEGDIDLGGLYDDVYVGGILGISNSAAGLDNQITLLTCYTSGDINAGVDVINMLVVGGIAGKAMKFDATAVATTMNIFELGKNFTKDSKNHKKCMYIGGLGGILGGNVQNCQAIITDSFTAGKIKVEMQNPNGAIGGFIGVYTGKIEVSYSATTIIYISDTNPVSLDNVEVEINGVSQNGIIGSLIGYSATSIANGKLTAYYVVDYTGCVLRDIESNVEKYGAQKSVYELTKPITDDGSTSSTFATTVRYKNGWVSVSYKGQVSGALNSYSMPLLYFLVNDEKLNAYCNFSEDIYEGVIDILSVTKTGEIQNNELAKNYEMYYGSKLYPYLISENSSITQFRNKVMGKTLTEGQQKVDVSDSYFILATSQTLSVNNNEVGFDRINFHLLGAGNTISMQNNNFFVDTLNDECFISGVAFETTYTPININEGYIYNSLISGDMKIPVVTGITASFVNQNKGIICSSGTMASVTIKSFSDANAIFAAFVGENKESGIINCCFSSGIIFIENTAISDKTDNAGIVTGFIANVEDNSFIFNITISTAMNVVNEYYTKVNLTINQFGYRVATKANINKVFIDRLANGYDGAYDMSILNKDRDFTEEIQIVNTYYMVDITNENTSTEEEDNSNMSNTNGRQLAILSGITGFENSSLAGKYFNYEYDLQFNYGYPYPALLGYYGATSGLMQALYTGNGTRDPYKISHAGKLDWMRSESATSTTKSFQIVADIYLNVIDNFNPLFGNISYYYSDSSLDVGEMNAYDKVAYALYTGNTNKDNNFSLSGYKDSNENYIIHYFNIGSKDNYSNIDSGLFGQLESKADGSKIQSVSNLTISNSTIYSKCQNIGILTGKATTIDLSSLGSINNQSTIYDVAALNSRIYCKDNSNVNIGGLIGELSGPIQKCTAEVAIETYVKKATEINVGGLVGKTTMSSTYSRLYAGSHITLNGIGDFKTEQDFDKLAVGGVFGFHSAEAQSTINDSISMTSINYAGLVAYHYTLDNYSTYESLKGRELTSDAGLTNYANLGNFVGAIYEQEKVDKETGESTYETTYSIEFSKCFFAKDITMIGEGHAVGNDLDCATENEVESIGYVATKNKLKEEDSSLYSTYGVQVGSKLRPFEIKNDLEINDSTDLRESNSIMAFSKGDFLFGMLTTNVICENIEEPLDLDTKFLYGANNDDEDDDFYTLTAKSGNGLFRRVTNSIISKINVDGRSTANYGLVIDGESFSSGGLVACYVESSLMYNVVADDGSVDSDATYVGAFSGYSIRSVFVKCINKNIKVSSGKDGARIGGIAGYTEKGGCWDCKFSGRVTAGSANSIVGGITSTIGKHYNDGETPKSDYNKNCFVILCKTVGGTIEAPGTNSIAGGITGIQYGVLATSQAGTKRNHTTVSAFKAGGVIGEIDPNGKKIYVQGHISYVNILDSIYGGGIISSIKNDTNVIANNKSHGNIITTGEEVCYLGGIVGYLGDIDNNSGRRTAKVENNESDMSIMVNKNYVGGIIGYANNSISIKGNKFAGDINNPEDIANFKDLDIEKLNSLDKLNIDSDELNYVGGIIGYAQKCNLIYDNIFAEGYIKGGLFAGGIIGYADNCTIGYDEKITEDNEDEEDDDYYYDEYEKEDEENDIDLDIDYEYREEDKNGEITKYRLHGNYNRGGTVIAKQTVGGIVGKILSGTIQNSESFGNVYAIGSNEYYTEEYHQDTDSDAGGIVGFMVQGTVKNNKINGESFIASTMNAGGIIGSIADKSLKIEENKFTVNKDEDNSNNVVIYGVYNAGGLTAYSSGKNTTSIKNNIYENNLISVISPYGNAGGLIGCDAGGLTFGKIEKVDDQIVMYENQVNVLNIIGYNGAGGWIGKGIDTDFIGYIVNVPKTDENGNVIYNQDGTEMVTEEKVLETWSVSAAGCVSGKFAGGIIGYGRKVTTDVKYYDKSSKTEEELKQPLPEELYYKFDIQNIVGYTIGSAFGYLEERCNIKYLSFAENFLLPQNGIRIVFNLGEQETTKWDELSALSTCFLMNVISEDKGIAFNDMENATEGHVGGVVGKMQEGEISYVINASTISTNASAAIQENNPIPTRAEGDLVPENVGGIIGGCDGATVKNVTFKGTLEEINCISLGGIIGKTYEENNNYTQVIDCVIITKTIGIVDEVAPKAYNDMKTPRHFYKNKEYNFSSIYAGAVAGYAENITIQNLTNSNKYVYALEYAGGFVGYMKNGTIEAVSKNQNETKKNMYNFGSWDDDKYILISSQKCAGGIVGYAEGNTTIKNIDIGITYKVEAMRINGGECAGGIVGYHEGSASTTLLIEDIDIELDFSYEIFSMQSSLNSVYAFSIDLGVETYAGGVLGYSKSGNVYIRDIYSLIQFVQAKDYAGGIVGRAQNVTIDNFKGYSSKDGNAGLRIVADYWYTANPEAWKDQDYIKQEINGYYCATYAGGAIAYATNATISAIYLNRLAQVCGFEYAGGYIGYAQKGNIIGSSDEAEGKIAFISIGTLRGKIVGGIIAINEGCTITMKNKEAVTITTRKAIKVKREATTNPDGSYGETRKLGIEDQQPVKYAGAVVGESRNGVINVDLAESITFNAYEANKDTSYVGGLVGNMVQGSINCKIEEGKSKEKYYDEVDEYDEDLAELTNGYFNINVNTVEGSTNHQAKYVGGFVGLLDSNSNLNMTKGVICSSVNAHCTSAGGIIGYNGGTISGDFTLLYQIKGKGTNAGGVWADGNTTTSKLNPTVIIIAHIYKSSGTNTLTGYGDALVNEKNLGNNKYNSGTACISSDHFGNRYYACPNEVSDSWEFEENAYVLRQFNAGRGFTGVNSMSFCETDGYLSKEYPTYMKYDGRQVYVFTGHEDKEEYHFYYENSNAKTGADKSARTEVNEHFFDYHYDDNDGEYNNDKLLDAIKNYAYKHKKAYGKNYNVTLSNLNDSFDFYNKFVLTKAYSTASTTNISLFTGFLNGLEKGKTVIPNEYFVGSVSKLINFFIDYYDISESNADKYFNHWYPCEHTKIIKETNEEGEVIEKEVKVHTKEQQHEDDFKRCKSFDDLKENMSKLSNFKFGTADLESIYTNINYFQYHDDQSTGFVNNLGHLRQLATSYISKTADNLTQTEHNTFINYVKTGFNYKTSKNTAYKTAATWGAGGVDIWFDPNGTSQKTGAAISTYLDSISNLDDTSKSNSLLEKYRIKDKKAHTIEVGSIPLYFKTYIDRGGSDVGGITLDLYTNIKVYMYYKFDCWFEPASEYDMDFHGDLNSDTENEFEVDLSRYQISQEALQNDPVFAAMMEEAVKHIGKEYELGMAGPNKFDCSNYVRWVLDHCGKFKTLDWRNAQMFYDDCDKIKDEDVKPGDLVFFTKTWDCPRVVSHIGIYVGDGMIIHAGDPIGFASISSDFRKDQFYGFGRIPQSWYK